MLLTDEKNLYSGDTKKIKRVIESSGFLKRRVADENTMTSDLCLQAAQDLIKNLEIKKEDLVSSNDDQGLHFYYISCFWGNLFKLERIKKIALKRINQICCVTFIIPTR